MAKDDSKDQKAPGATPPAEVAKDDSADAPAFAPKRGDFVTYTETVKSGRDKGATKIHFLLVTEVGTTTGPKRDSKGNVVTKEASVKFGDGTRNVTQAVMETVPVFGGVIISAQEQFPRPVRGILLQELSPLEA